MPLTTHTTACKNKYPSPLRVGLCRIPYSPPPDDRSSLPALLEPALTFFFSSFSPSPPHLLLLLSTQPVPSRVSPLWCHFSGLSWRSLGWWEWGLTRPLVRLAALWGGSGSLSPRPPLCGCQSELVATRKNSCRDPDPAIRCCEPGCVLLTWNTLVCA